MFRPRFGRGGIYYENGGRLWMPIQADKPMALVVTYFQDEWLKRTFGIMVDGEKIAEQVVEYER
jgi:hypothetical protein